MRRMTIPHPHPRPLLRRAAATLAHDALTLALVFSFAAAGGPALAGPPPAPYGAEVEAPRKVPIHFADFDLTYLGERTVPVPVYARGYFVYHDFRVTHGAESFDISWTSGTGAIAPLRFTVAGRRFLLERGCAERFGCSLKPNEVVITNPR